MVLTDPGQSQTTDEQATSGRSLPGTLAYWADATPAAPALSFTDFDDRIDAWTYSEFRNSVVSAAKLLESSGLSAGDRCVLHTGNSRGFMILFWAVQELGAVAVPTIAQYSEDELAFVIADCDASVVVSTPLLEDVAAAAIGDSGRVLLTEGDIDDGLLKISHRQGDPLAEPRTGRLDRDVALILYTSGTTSRPKGVMLTHGSVLYTARTYAEHFRLQTGDRTLVCLPLFHANGLLLQMMPVILSGGHMIVTPRFSASRYWRWIDEFEVSVAHLVAGPLRLLRSGDEMPSGNRRVRLMSFGMPLTSEEIAAFEDRFGIPLVMVWGSTETGCGGTLMPLDADRRPGHQNVGQAMPGWQVELVDPDTGTQVADGDVGEFRVKSDGIMKGYLGQPEATAAALREGWVLTGDLGWRDADGYFHFVDRLKDMLKPSGENVAASEVERVITDHPKVHKCAVVGLPDPVRMEIVIAAIVPEPGEEPAESEIREWCAARLASFKVPSRVQNFTELPETSIGKTRKAELKQLLLASTGEDE